MVRRLPNNSIKCPKKECKDASLVTDPETGEVICENCGQVLKVDAVSFEGQKTYDTESYMKRSRTGMPASLRTADKGLSTMIGKSQDSAGRELTAKSKQRYNKLKFWDRRLKSKTTSFQNLRKGLGMIETLRTKLSLSENIAEDAAYIYRKAHDLRLSRGRTIRLLATASLYAACRSNGIPRNLTEISNKSNVDRKSLSGMYRQLVQTMEFSFTPYTPESFISKIASQLQINEKIKRKAIKLLTTAREERISIGKRPIGLAAAALYLACILNNMSISQKDIAQAANISSVTIRKWYKKLYEISKEH